MSYVLWSMRALHLSAAPASLAELAAGVGTWAGLLRPRQGKAAGGEGRGTAAFWEER